MSNTLLRTVTIALTMVAGFALPQAGSATWVLRALVMTMLWLALLDVRLGRITRDHLVVVGTNWAIGLAAWALLSPVDGHLAAAGLLVGLTPTATAGPAMMRMLRGDPGFVAEVLLLTNASVGLFLPLVVPVLVAANGVPVHLPVGEFLLRTMGTVLVPVVLAQVMRVATPDLARGCLRLRRATFAMWLAMVFLAVAVAGGYLRQQSGHVPVVVGIAAVSGLICVANFWLGGRVVRADLLREGSQSLGQKNTMLSIWVGVTFIHPLVALGPGMYVLWQNGWNTWQMVQADRRADD